MKVHSNIVWSLNLSLYIPPLSAESALAQLLDTAEKLSQIQRILSNFTYYICLLLLCIEILNVLALCFFAIE